MTLPFEIISYPTEGYTRRINITVELEGYISENGSPATAILDVELAPIRVKDKSTFFLYTAMYEVMMIVYDGITTYPNYICFASKRSEDFPDDAYCRIDVYKLDGDVYKYTGFYTNTLKTGEILIFNCGELVEKIVRNANRHNPNDRPFYRNGCGFIEAARSVMDEFLYNKRTEEHIKYIPLKGEGYFLNMQRTLRYIYLMRSNKMIWAPENLGGAYTKKEMMEFFEEIKRK